MDNLANKIAKLPPEKRALLELRLKQKSWANGSVQQVVPRRASSAVAPLSFAQQRLWFLDQLEPGSAVYNVPGAFRLKGSLDINALGQSLNEIIRRHEVLRTTFKSVDGSPLQIVASELTLPLPVVDLSDRPESERDSQARRMAADEAGRPFDLAQGPLLRVTLLRMGQDDHVLLLTMHHIVSDGWSAGVLYRELSTLYRAFSQGKPSPLPELPLQYADFAVWQREWLRGEMLEKQLGYWLKKLEDVATLQLPVDRPRPPVQTFRGAHQSRLLNKELTNGLMTLGRKEGVTLFMILLAAFQTLLHRYTRQDDIAVGSPIAGRNRIEIEPLIGFFVNTLVLRSDLSDNPTFRELLGRVREVALGAYAHQDIPFEKLVEELQPERSLSHSPLFQVVFVLQNAPSTALGFEHLTVNRMRFNSEMTKFDLSLTMREEAEGLSATLSYNTDLFDPATIERMLGHFEFLLGGIVTDPNQRIADLPMLTDVERRQLLVEWNDTKIDDPKKISIHELFEEQAQRTPDAVAVVFPSTSSGRGEVRHLSYRELNQRANQLAHYLRKLGVGPDVLVGICIQRSLEMIVGILGILKAGGAYVPLDPEYPKERLAFMLEDTQAPVLVTQSKLLSALPETIVSEAPVSTFQNRQFKISNRAMVCLDKDWEQITKESQEKPESGATAENLAYVIYTSGSTGTPKGVLIRHVNVTRLFQTTASWFHFSHQDVWSLFHSFAFDFSVWEMWGALLHGGRLVIVPLGVSRSPERFYELLLKEKITVLNQIPSAFRQLIELEPVRKYPAELALRVVIFGGEALNFQSLRPWFDRHGDQQPRLINMYGITETTVHVTYRPLTATDPSAVTGSLIGVRIPDLKIYILDAAKHLVPIGVPGELYVGGAGVSMGYLNRPELTDARFIPNPFDCQTGERLYRSGDLVRRRGDGDIEYLGRIDSQVKIRGYRIELGEIESVLSRYSAVQECVVVAQEEAGRSARGTGTALSEGENPKAAQQTKIQNSNSLDRRLVSYIVAKAGYAPTTSELRTFLKDKIPEYMVPSAFVFLESLPLTPNGKIDRKALPAPDQSRPELEKAFIMPRDLLELELTNIWERNLAIKPIGVRDNFFELGGHSLLAVRLFVDIEKTIGRHLPIATIFQAPTIEQLAGILKQNKRSESLYSLWSEYPSSVVPFQPKGSKLPLFWFSWGPWDFRLPRYLGSDQPVYGLQHQSQDGHRALHTSIEKMAAYYIREMRTVQAKGPYFLGGFCIGGMVGFEMAQQLQKNGEKVALLVLLDPSNPRSGELSSVPRAKPSISSQVTWFSNKVHRHLRELAPLGPQEKLSYARVRAQERITGLMEKFEWIARKVLCETLNYPLPPSLRAQYIDSIYGRALRAYVPQLYRGRVILFKSQGTYRNGQLHWTNLITSGLEIQELDTNQENVFTEPYVQRFAERLKARLSEAHRNVTERPNSTGGDAPTDYQTQLKC